MRSVSITKSLAAASANNIALSQSVAAGANAVINGAAASGGVATLNTQRRVIITSAGNDSANTATIVGTRQTGQPVSEVLTLANAAAAASFNDYYTVTSVTFSGATASTVTIGTNTTGSTDWIMLNYNITPFSVLINEELTGSVTFNIEGTQSNLWYVPAVPSNQPPVQTIATALSAATQEILTAPVTGLRFTITAGTGTLAAQVTQAGITNM